jgi:hypothetical protein
MAWLRSRPLSQERWREEVKTGSIALTTSAAQGKGVALQVFGETRVFEVALTPEEVRELVAFAARTGRG